MQIADRLAHGLPIRYIGIASLADVAVFEPHPTVVSGWSSLHPVCDRIHYLVDYCPLYILPACPTNEIGGSHNRQVLNVLRQLHDGDQWIMGDMHWHCYSGLACFEDVAVENTNALNRQWWIRTNRGTMDVYCIAKMLTPEPMTTYTPKWQIRVATTLPESLCEGIAVWHARQIKSTRDEFSGASLYPVD